MSFPCCTGSGIPRNPEEEKASKEIDKMLQANKKKEMYKLLLLGTGESGKSTIAKQMKIIHLNGYNNPDEQTRFRPVVYSNVFENTKILLQAATEKFNYTLDAKTQTASQRILAINDDDIRSPDFKGLGEQLLDDFLTIWNDPLIQKTFERSSEYQLNDSTKYFFDNLERIATLDYVPTRADILRVRAKTTGINEIEFKIGGYNFHMTDVGGQRSERRKWIHCFESVTAIIFCAAMSEYDQKLYEDESTNRMSEALRLFGDISNSRWFCNTPVILFLNKKDIFEEKIKRVPLSVCFEDYKGQNEYEEASEYIKEQFIAQLKPPRPIYTFKACATDTENIKKIFNSVKGILLNDNLDTLGIGGNVGGGGYDANTLSRTNTVRGKE